MTGLVKLGIDPEAYCFLCKKEFCSKYFLKTHKLNMHGVGSERAEQGQRGVPRGTITPPTSVSPVSAYSPAQQPAASIDTFQWRWKDGNQVGSISYQINLHPVSKRRRRHVPNSESQIFTNPSELFVCEIFQ